MNGVTGKAFSQKMFSGITRELKDLRDIVKINETFLFYLLENFEIEQGTVVLFDLNTEEPLIVSRDREKKIVADWPQENIRSLAAYLAYLLKKVKDKHRPYGEAELLPDSKPLNLKTLFNRLDLAFWFVFHEDHVGFLALRFEKTLAADTIEKQEVIKDLINIFLVFLERAKAWEKVRDLTLEVEQKRDQLKKLSIDLSVSERRIQVFEKSRPRLRQAFTRELEQSRRVSIMDIILILGFGLVLGTVFNLVNPGGINPIPQVWLHSPLPEIDTQSAKMDFDSGKALFIDARPNNQFTEKHLRGALNLPLAVFDFVYMMKFNHINPDRELIVYGRNISRYYDQEVAYLLASRGHLKIKVLSGGLTAWLERGYPTGP
jgi:rhodanese-related sulfurtransferase